MSGRPDPERKAIIALWSDGEVTARSGEAANRELSVLMGELARAGLRLDFFAVGPLAHTDHSEMRALTVSSGGLWRAVQSPKAATLASPPVTWAGIDQVIIDNLTTGLPATQLALDPAGHFGATVPVAPGRNRLRIVAEATDGSRWMRERVVEYAPDAPVPAFPRGFEGLEARLQRDRALSLEAERIEAVRREQMQRQIELDLQR